MMNATQPLRLPSLPPARAGQGTYLNGDEFRPRKLIETIDSSITPVPVPQASLCDRVAGIGSAMTSMPMLPAPPPAVPPPLVSQPQTRVVDQVREIFD